MLYKKSTLPYKNVSEGVKYQSPLKYQSIKIQPINNNEGHILYSNNYKKLELCFLI